MNPAIFDASPIGTVLIRAGVIVYANEAVSRIVQRRREELVGQPFTAFVAPEEILRLLERYERRRNDEPVPPSYEVALLAADGSRPLVEVAGSFSEELTMVQLLRDVTQEGERRAKLAVMARLGVSVQAERTDVAVYRKMIDGLVALGLSVVVLEPDSGGLVVRASGAPLSTSSRVSPILGDQMVGLRGQWSQLTQATWADGAGFIDDAPLDFARFLGGETGERIRQLAASAGVYRAFAWRVDIGGVQSAMVIGTGDWPSQGDLPAVRLFGAQVSAALDAARAIEGLSRRNAELASLNRLAALAGTAPDLATLFSQGTQEISRVLGCEEVSVFLLDSTGRSASLVHRHGGTPSAEPHFFDIDGPNAGLWEVAFAGEAKVFRRAEHPPVSLSHELIASVPLIAHSRVVGVMNVAFDRPRLIERSDIELMTAMGSHFAAAVASQRLLEDLRGRVADLGLLHEVGRSLVATLEPSQVLDLGVRNLARSVGAPEAYLLLEDGPANALVVRAISGSHLELLGQAFPLDPPHTSVAASAFRERAPVAIEDGLVDPRVHPGIRKVTGGRAYLALPLILRDRPIGAVVILDPRGPKRYSPAEIERASAIANQLAVAVENARLYDDLRASYEKLALAQAQSLQKERLAALGELAAVVAHEVRNPLGAIFNSITSLNRMLRPTGDAKLLLSILAQEAERLNSIVGDLLDFARPSPPALRPEPLARVLNDAVRAALGGHRPEVKVQQEIDPALPKVPMDERLLRQAVLNIALNALQAMPSGGSLTIRAHPEQGPKGAVARIEVSDTGAGISPEARSHIFEPFFTTKAAGTGLGLALVKRIIDDHKGELEVSSVPGRGTTFTLRLPLEVPASYT